MTQKEIKKVNLEKRYILKCGNNIDLIKKLDDNSVDSIVTDPPYELGFMNKSWDSTGIAFNVELWKEALRVLKPGGHLIAFSGSRTYHRMAVAIEDSGFQIRDQIMWVYGSGFPKSLDVSKAIDKKGGNPDLTKQVSKALKEARIKRGISITQADKMFCNGSTLYSWYEGRPVGIQLPTSEYMIKISNEWEELKPFVGLTMEAEREVIGIKKTNLTIYQAIGEENTSGEINITAPSTEQAKQWKGWGTALKPATEPIVLARKPLSEKTVAENVLKWGVGALNIDVCRIDYNGEKPNLGGRAKHTRGDGYGFKAQEENAVANELGRWPANFIHDGLEEEWSRYFYCAKASKKDRNEGLDRFEEKASTDRKGNGLDRVCNLCGTAQLKPCNCVGNEWIVPAKHKNNHPTVKPTDLMAYLVRLVTPPNGVVLDPFNGSGSTGKACMREGFRYIGFDLSKEYINISRFRINNELNK